MPLSKLYRMDKGKFEHNQQKNNTRSTDPPFRPVNDFAELVWENGQIMMHGQSSRQRKTSNSNTLPSYDLPSNSSTLPSYDLPSQTLKPRNTDAGNSSTNSKVGKFGTTADCIMNDFLLDQDDEMVPWLNYHIDDDSLQQDYCSDFLTGLSGVTENELSTSQSNFASIEKRSNFDHNHSNSVNNRVSIEQGLIPKASDGKFCKHQTSQLYPLLSPHQTSFPFSLSVSNATSDATHNAVCENLSLKAQNLDSRPPKSSSGFMNFSHFSRPASMIKANLHDINAFANPNLPSEHRIGCKDKESLPELSHIDLTVNLCKGMTSQSQPMMASNNVNMKFLMDKTIYEPHNVEQSNVKCHADASKNDKIQSLAIGSNSYKDIADVGEKTIEGVVASSSTCSVSSVDKTSNDPPHDLKRKCRDIEESDYPSDDVEEESVGAKKTASSRGGSGSKRGRAAEVHNLSERKRRDRINEKMRALQELIPNCNKVDKASMLDEAIEYLKTLQIQVQIMSMGAGIYMRPMMLPTGMQHMHATHMPHFSPMGMGMGFGMGMVDVNYGSPGYPVMPVPSMEGGHFRGSQIFRPSSMNGMPGSNHPMFGLASQGHPMSIPGASLSIPGDGGPMRSLHTSHAFSSKDTSMNGLQVMQHTNGSRLMNQISSQETNQGLEDSGLILKNDQAADVNGSGTRNSKS